MAESQHSTVVRLQTSAPSGFRIKRANRATALTQPNVIDFMPAKLARHEMIWAYRNAAA